MSKSLNWVMALLCAAMLTACGGGGSGPSSTVAAASTPTSTVPAAASVDILASSNQVGSGGEHGPSTALYFRCPQRRYHRMQP